MGEGGFVKHVSKALLMLAFQCFKILRSFTVKKYFKA